MTPDLAADPTLFLAVSAALALVAGGLLLWLRKWRALRRSVARLTQRTAELEAEVAARAAQMEAADRERRKSEERFRGVVENSPSAIFLKDLAGRFSLVNRRFEEWYGIAAADALGKTSHEIFPDDYANSYVAQDREVLAQGKVVEREQEICFRDGGTHTILVTKFPVMDGSGKPLGIGTINTDLTEHKRMLTALRAAKDQAEEASRAKTEFLANMSHELRTPLNWIIGFAELMKNEMLGPIGDGRYRGYIEDIHVGGLHLLDLINDLLDLAQIESGNAKLNEERFGLTELIGSCVKMMSERASSAGITLRLDTASQPRTALYGDPRLVKQILINLLSNSIKFTPRGGTVSVSCPFSPDGAFLLQVRDTGIGMAPDDIPKALGRFQQIESHLSRKAQGSGLGLALTKSFVELHGGRLDLQSELGKGTTVTAVFPAERLLSDEPQEAEGALA